MAITMSSVDATEISHTSRSVGDHLCIAVVNIHGADYAVRELTHGDGDYEVSPLENNAIVDSGRSIRMPDPRPCQFHTDSGEDCTCESWLFGDHDPLDVVDRFLLTERCTYLVSIRDRVAPENARLYNAELRSLSHVLSDSAGGA